MKERIILERCYKRSFKIGAEIPSIKELELFVSPAGEKIKTLAADMDESGGLGTNLYHIRKMRKGHHVCVIC